MSTNEKSNEERCQELLIDYGFSNDIDDLPEAGTPIPVKERKKAGRKPSIETAEMDKLRSKREAEFRSWLIANRPDNCVMVPIETNTVTGVPDIYSCYLGHSFWLECKSLAFPSTTYLRGTQYLFFKKLVEAGGMGKVLTQYIDIRNGKPTSIQIYNVADIVCHPIDFFRAVGQRLYFPKSIKPAYVWLYNETTRYQRGKTDQNIDYLYQRIFLDTDDFIW